MDALQKYSIQFIGLKIGEHTYSYPIDNRFFENYKYDDFQSIACDVYLNLVKKANLMEVQMHIVGKAVLQCDTTNEAFDEPLDTQLNFIVKFGDYYDDTRDDVLIIPRNAFEFNVAQYIYEAIVLALPVKRVHPGLLDGTLKSIVLDKLKELEIKDKTEEIDPRWDKLNNLLTK